MEVEISMEPIHWIGIAMAVIVGLLYFTIASEVKRLSKEEKEEQEK